MKIDACAKPLGYEFPVDPFFAVWAFLFLGNCAWPNFSKAGRSLPAKNTAAFVYLRRLLGGGGGASGGGPKGARS